MHVLLDAHMLGEQEGGNETYIAGLLSGLHCVSSPQTETISVLYTAAYYASLRQHAILPAIAMRSRTNIRRVFSEIPGLCRRLGVDALHATYVASPILSARLILTVHDVIFRLYPQYFSPRDRLLLLTLLPLSMRRAHCIITVSEASKADIVQYYPFVREKIVAIPEAAGPVAAVEPDARAVQELLDGSPFILTVGTLQPRKNLVRLIKAYIQLRSRSRARWRLLIVGRAAWQHSEVYQLVRACPFHGDIVFTGYLPDAAVAALYRRCVLFAYPSLYEGFGLPVLEAMACGAPVLAGNRSSIPEVAGDAAVLVDPLSVPALTDAMEQILTTATLQDDLRQRGQARAALFSWDRTARETLNVYRRVVEGS